MATEAVSIQEPISMVEKMATEAVIIQEPISVVEKLAAEAVIIAEPISLAKSEEDSKNLTLEVSTNNNGVETENIVFESNPEISKGESFLISPEISMVANETTKMLEHIEVDGSAFKAEKIPEDEENMVIRNEEKDRTQDGIRKDDINYGSEEIKERCSMDSHDPIVEILKDANETVSDAGNSDRVQEDTLAKRVAESEGIACIHEPEVDEKFEEVSSEEIKCIKGDVQDENLFHTSVVETKASDIRTENAVEECPTEETGRSEMNENTDQDFGMSGELCKDYANSELENVVVDMIQVAYKEPAMTDPSDEMKRDEESEVAAPGGDIIEPEHEPEHEPVSILNDKPVSPINVVYENVDTTISSGTAETSASIKGATSSKDCEESSDREGRGTNVVKENVEDDIRAEKVTDKVDSLEKENEVCKESETEASGTGKENPETKEYPIAAISESNSSISDETVNESIKEGESSPMKLSEEASNSKVDKDPSTLDVKESKEEIIPVELKEELARSSSFEPEESGKDTEEETNTKEDEALGEKDEITNVDAIEEIGIATTEHEGIGVEGANIDVNSTVSTVTCEKIVEILEPREEDGMQVEILNAGSEDQMEMTTTKEIPLKEVLGDEVKEHSTVTSEEYETVEERRLTETSEKDQDPFEHSEKVGADVIPNTDTESTVTKAVDDIKIHEESTVLILEGSITEAGNSGLVGQSGEEILESFQQMNEPENKKPACPFNVVSEDVDTAETSPTIEEATSIEDHEERSEGEVREDSPAHHLQIEVNENKKTVEVEIANENADDLQANVASVAQLAENEQGMQFELPDVLSEERVHEAIGASKEKEEDSEDVSKACKSSDSINPEQIFTEAAATTDSKPETSKMDNGNLMSVEEVYLLDSEQCSESNEALENKEDRIQQELEECTTEKLELKDAVENMEDNSIHEETKEVVEKLESDNTVEIAEKRILEDEDTENQITLKEVSGSETAASGTEKEEIKLVEEELVHSSSLELEESKKDTEEETTVKECIETADLDCTSQAAESEESNLKEVKAEAEGEEEKNEINNVIDCKDNVIGIESANTDVKSADSYILSEKDIGISREEYVMQDKIQNAGSEDQMEMTIEEIPLKEVLGDEMKEISTMPSEDYEGTLIEQTIVVDGTLEEDQALHKHSEDVAVDVQPVENEALEHKEEGIIHELEDYSAEKPEPKDAVENIEDISKLEETNEVLEDPNSIIKEACGIIDDSLKSTEIMKEESKEENTAAMVPITETSNSIIEEKVSIEETAKSDNDPSLFDVAKESKEEITPIEVKEDHVHSSLFELDESRNLIEEEISEAEMEETNVKEAEAETEEEKNEINDAAVVEENSVERTEHEEIGILSAEIEVKSVDSYVTDEKDMEIPEEHFPKAESEDTGNEIGHEVEEQLAEESNVEVTNVSSGEEHRELENQTDACKDFEDGKPLDEAIDLEETSSTCKDDEKVIEEENLAKNLEKTESLKEDTEIENQDHIPEMVTMTDNAKVEDYSSVSTECLKETESEEHIVAENLEVEEHSINDGEASHVTRAVEETRQEKESGDPITVHCEDREAEEKMEEIINDSKLSHDEGCIEAVTVVSSETSLNDTEKIVNASNITPVEMSLENIESDANQETEVENVQLEEISSELYLDVQTKDNDEVQKQNLNMETVDKDEAEVIQRVPDAFYMLEVRVPEAEKGLIAETMDGLNRDHELVVMKNEASKNADELGKIEDIGSPNTVLGVKPEEQIQTSACTLLSDDDEIGTGNPVEKIEEMTQKDDEIKHESQEDSSETMTIDEVCLSEKRELEAVSEEETIADQVPLHDKPEEKTETASSTLPSEESEHGTRAISEEIEYRTTTEELPTEVDVVTGDEVTGEQTLSDDKPEEGTTSTPLVSEEDGEGNLNTVEKQEEEKTYEADMIPNKISEDISVVETTAETCLEEEELLELDGGKRDAAEKEDEKTNEAEIIGDENEEDALDAKTTLEICSKTERSIEVEAVAEDEVAAGETLTEKISDEEVQNPTSALPSKEEECESTITAEMTESGKTPDDNGEDEFFHKECLREDEVLVVYKSASSQVNPTEKPEDLPNPVDTLPTDQLHLTTSMLSSEVQGDEMMGSELKEDESPEKIPEQTREIEEADDFNTEIHEKDFDNELIDGKDDAAIQEKLVKSGTKTWETIPNEVSTEKEDKMASENENPIVDQTVEHPGQASSARIETTVVTEENVEPALAGLEEKPESDLEPVAEDQSEKTIAEHTEIQDVETSIDIQYKETEEPIKEPKDNINGEESTNKVTKAAILSEVVDKEVEKVGIEDTKEQVMEEKSGTNELRPILKGDEATDELEDYSGERIEEVKLEEQIDIIGSPNTVLEVKPEEHIQTLLPEDEQIGTANPVEKIEEEKQKDAEIVHFSREVSSETKTIEEACLSNEGQKELKAVSEEEISADQVPLNDEPEEQIQTTPLTLQFKESEHGTGARSEETKYGKTEEELPAKLDIVTGDEVTCEQALSDNKPEEGTTSTPLVSEEDGEESVQTVENTEEEKIYEGDMIADKISEDLSVVETTAEVCLEKEELLELDDSKKDDAEKEDEKTNEAEIIRDEIEEDAKDSNTTLKICSQMERSVVLEAVAEDEMTAGEKEDEKTNEAEIIRDEIEKDAKDSKITLETCSQTERSVVLEAVAEDEMTAGEKEDEKTNEAEIIRDEIEEDAKDSKTTLETCSQTERSVVLEAVADDEMTAGEKEDEKTNEAEIIRDEIEEDAKDSKTTLKTCSQTERSVVLEAVADDEMTAGEKEDEKTNEAVEDSKTTLEICSQTERSVVLKVVADEMTAGEKEDEKTNEAEIIKDEIEEDAKDSKTTLETCSQTERSVVLEGVADDEMTAGETLAEKTSDEVKNPTSALPLKEEESESTITAEMLEALAVDENTSSPAEKHEDLLKAVDTLPTDQLHLTTSMLPSEVQGDERKETELNEDESPEKIAEQTMEIEEASGLNTEIHEKAFDNELSDETEDAANQEKLVKAATETTEIILNEVSTEKVIMESQKTNENENLSEDKSVDDLGQASVAKIETTAVTKENVELAPAGLEEKPESDLEPFSEDQSKETITEHAESQDVETIIDIPNQETEEQIKEELKDNPETDDSINEEEKSNEVTEAVILSEEVGKEVEKADCIEDIKEHVMEEESSTNGLHPISKGDEANNEVGDYSAVSTERIEKVEFEEQIEEQNTEVEENSTEEQGSHITIELDEGRQEEEFGHPLMVCGEDREKEEIEGIIDDSKLRQDESRIDAVNTSNISSVKMNLETIESDANQETEVIEKVQLEEMSSNLAPQVRTNDNDEEEVIKSDPDAFYIAKDHIAEAESGPIAALEADKVEETEGVRETLSHYTSERIETVLKDDISSTNTLPEEKLEQLQISARTLLSEDEEVQKDTEIKHEILEDYFDTETIEEVCLPNEEQSELIAVSEEEIIADKGLPNDEPKEQIQTTPSALPSSESDYRTGGMTEETAIKLDVVTGDEKTGEQTLETNKPEEETTSSPSVSMEEEEPESSFEKIEEEKLSEADIPDKNSEDFSDAMKTAETCSEKQVFQELDDATEDETAAAQALQVQESHKKSLTSDFPVENLKHGAEANEEKEEEKAKEVEMLEKEGPREPEAVVDPEIILARATIAEESQEIETIVIVENLDEKNIEGDTKDGTTLLTEKMSEESKEDNTAKMVSITEASNSIIEETVSIEETEKSSNDTILFDIEKELKEEITPIEVKDDHVHSSSFELEESKNVTEEETSVAETEETNIKEAEKEEERNETNDDVVVEENTVEITEHEDISVCSAENDVKSVDSYITPEQDMEIPKEEDAIQDEVPNARTGDQLEMSTKEIPLKETLGDEVEDHDAAHSEERKISDGTSEKDQVPYEHSETLLSQATDEKLIQNDDNPHLDVPKAEPEDTGNETGHEVEEQLAEEPSSVEVTNVSTEEEHIELENQPAACEARTLHDEKSSDLGPERENIEDVMSLDEATDLGETLGTCKDDGKTIEEENLDDNLEKPESLKEDTEIVKDQIPDMVIINDNAKVEDYSSVSTECLKEVESEEQIVAENLHVKENSTNDREAFSVTKELEETRQNEETVDPVSVQSEDQEAEEKTEIIVDSSMCCHESCIEAVTDVNANSSLNDNNEILTAPNIRSIETSRENIETDAKQETEVEDVQLEEMPSELDPDVQTNDNGVDAALQREPLKEDEALVVHDIEKASSQAIQTEKPEERIQNPAVTLPSEHGHETVDDVDKTGEMKDGDSDGGKTVEVKMREPAAMLEGETHTSHIIAEESEDHKAVTGENKIEEAEPFEDRKIPQSEDGAAAVHIFPENETKETELTEDKSLENIQEQTREIEEASNVNVTCEKAFDNELLTETADAPNEKKIVTARDETEDEESQCKNMNEGHEITVNEVSNEEVMEGKEVTETSYSTSLSEEMIEDGSGEDEQKDKLIKDNTYKENVEPESVSEIVAEEQIKEALPELTNDQDHETSIDVWNQETEELIKYELKDEDSANKEENTNKAIEAAVLSEKVDDSEDIIENVIEEERSTNELHPVSKGDEATNEVEDYSAVSTECIKEAESMEQIDEENSEVINTSNISSVKMSLETIESGTKQKTEEVEKVQLEEISSGLAPEVPTNENDEAEVSDRGIEAFYMAKSQIAETENGTTEELEAYDVKETEGETETSVDYTSERVEIILKDDIRSTNTSPEETLEEQLQSSTSTLLLEDEHIRIENPVEKIEEETHGDAEIKHVTREVSSETKRIEDACFPSEEQRELEAISKEETIANQGLPNDEPEEEIQTTSSTLPSEENEKGSRAISEEITPEQTLEKNEPEERTTISLLDPKGMEEENICTIEKTEEELNKLDMIPDKISEHFEDAIKDETTVAQASEAEESNEQSLTPELTVENIKHGAMANDEEDEEVSEVKLREREMCLEKEGPQKLEAVVDQETIVSWASIPEEPHKIEGISIVEKLDEEKIKGNENLNNDNCEGSSAGVTEELNELKLVTKEEITSSDQIFPEEHLHISSSAITSEELDYEPKETEDEKKSKREIEKDEIVKDASDASTTVETCSLKGSFVVLEVVSENEMTARMAEKTESEKIDEAEFLQDDNRKDVTLQKELYQENDVPAVEEQILSPIVLPSEEQILSPVVFPSEEQKLETINEVNKTEEDHMKEKEMENGGFDGVKPVEEISTEKDEMKEAESVLEGETNHLHITTPALSSEVQGDETNESESKEDESPEKMREQTGEIEEASNFKTDTCEKALDNELLAETEDGAIKENPVKVNDITLNEVSTEKVVKSKEVTETSCSSSCPEMLMKDVSTEDEVKYKPVEGKIYEENVEPELAGFEEKPKSDSESVAEDQSKETIPEVTKNQDDETRTDVWNEETEEHIKEELKDEDYINREENANGVTKAIISSEKIEEVEKADGSEDLKEHVIEKETSTNELHLVSRETETNNEVISVEDCSSVSTECIKEAESEEQIEAENSEVEENSTNDKKVSHVTKALEEKSQAEESRDTVYVHAEHREAEEKVEITDDLKLDESNIEAAAEVRAGTSLNSAEVKEHVNTSNISSAKMSIDAIETDANQETDEVEKVQLEEIFSDLAPKIPTNDSDEVELIKRDPDVFYMHEDKVENGSTAELEADKVEETEGVPETSSNCISQRIQTILIDDISSTNTIPEGKPDERPQSSACTLLSENEEIGIAKPVEKIEEEIRNDAKTMEKVCLPEEANLELEAVLEEETTADKVLPNDEPEEKIQTAYSTFPSEERDLDVVQGNEVTSEQNLETSSRLVSMEDEEIVSSIEKIEEGNINEVDIPEKTSQDFSVAEKMLKICLEKDEFQELDHAKKGETAAPQAIQLEESNEQPLILESLVENPNHGAEANEEEKKVEEVEILEKEGLKEPEAVVNQETVVSQASITERSQNIEATGIVEKLEEEKMKEAEKLNNGNREDSLAEETEKLNELHLVTKEEIIAGQSFSEQLHISASAITSELLEHETKDKEAKKTSEGEVIKDETKEDASDAEKTVEVCSQMERSVEPEAVAENKMTAGTIEKVESEKTEAAEFLNITELQEDGSHEKIQEETGEIEEASNFNMGIHEKAFDNELLNETEDAAVKENLVKARDEPGCEGNQCEKTNEGNEIILSEVSENVASYSTSHSEDPTKDGLGQDALKDELIEDNTYEELIVEAQKTNKNEIIEKHMEDRVVEDQGLASVVVIETTTESGTEISAAESNEILDNIQQTEETTKTPSDMQIPRELDPIENTGITSSVAKEHVSIELQDRVAESSQKAIVGDVREIYPGVECVGEKTDEEVTEGYVLVEDSTKFSSYDPLESFTKESLQVTRGMIEREVKDETNASQVPLVEKTEKESPAPVDDIEKKELKEVETQDKGFSDTKSGGEISYEEEEKKELKVAVEQETIAIQAPQTKIKDDPVSHFEASSKEDEHTGDKTNETLKVATCEIQNEKPFAETQKDDANDNIKTVAEDQTVKGDINEATIVKEEIPGKEEPIESKKTTNSTGKQQLLIEQQTVVGDFEPGNAQETCSEAGEDNGEGKRPDNLGVEKSEGPEPVDSAKLSLYDLLQRSTRKTIQGTENLIEDRELIVSNEQAPEEEAKTDEEEGDEHNRIESGSKPHKKPHNILSGVGSKVKQSISKVKKAITGKSSHPKEPKPISPKESKK